MVSDRDDNPDGDFDRLISGDVYHPPGLAAALVF